MVAFDTNYLVRHLVQDDEAQTRTVGQVLAGELAKHLQVLLLDLVIVETCWVLKSCYGFDRKAWIEVLGELLDDTAFAFEDEARLRSAIKRFKRGKADFSDYLIDESARSHRCRLESFDKHLLGS